MNQMGENQGAFVEETGVDAPENGRQQEVSETTDPEVVAGPERRRFTAEEKYRILAEADQCEHGELGAMLRREGVYYTQLRRWRRARDRGAFEALEEKKPGPVPSEPNLLEIRVRDLEKELRRTKDELAKAKLIIDVQKKVSELLGLSAQGENSETP